MDYQSRWNGALDQFEEAEKRRGIAASTTARRIKDIRRFAGVVKMSPWHVTPGDVSAWLAKHSAAARPAARDSLRAFYRWAVQRGWMGVSPAVGKNLNLPVPEAWDEPLAAYERYLRAKGLAPTSVRTYMEHMRTFARDNGVVGPFDVTTDDVYEWMACKEWTRETRRSRKTIVSSFYVWAVATERTGNNPTAHLPTVKAGDPVARPATDEEYRTALKRAKDPRWALALRLAAELGLRRAEVAQVHSADLQATAGGVWLAVHGKGGKTRRLPVPHSLAVVLAQHDGYIFPGAIVEKQRARGEGHISARYLGKQLAELLPNGVTAHALRHRFATRAYNVNRDVFTVQRLLGHSSASTTQRYVQVSDERMRELVEGIA